MATTVNPVRFRRVAQGGYARESTGLINPAAFGLFSHEHKVGVSREPKCLVKVARVGHRTPLIRFGITPNSCGFD